ncbi:MAG: hypothetical protein COB98_07505 [Flavobacteriaceae bacterium]|nr:MAG: hypothetical protein COB98_07505 [Flavobacteriaceae bacterium]
MKKLIAIAFIVSNGMFISCTDEANTDISNYQNDMELYGTGGEESEDRFDPPIPPPIYIAK